MGAKKPQPAPNRKKPPPPPAPPPKKTPNGARLKGDRMERIRRFIETAMAGSTLRVLGGAECVPVRTASSIAVEAAEAAARATVAEQENRRMDRLMRCAAQLLRDTIPPLSALDMDSAARDALRLEHVLRVAIDEQEGREPDDSPVTT